MRIISSFNDYYDTVLYYGVDKTCTYFRNPEPAEIKNLEQLENILVKMHSNVGLKSTSIFRKYSFNTDINSPIWYSEDETIYLGFLGFCGFAFPVYRTPWGLSCTYAGILNRINSQSLREKMRTCFEEENYKTNRKNKGNIYFTYKIAEKIQTVCSFIKIPDRIFQDYNTPCFLYLGDKKRTVKYDWKYFKEKQDDKSTELVYNLDNQILINPVLSDLSFAGHYSTFSAYQAIYQYLSGVLVRTEDHIARTTGDDADLARSKGFDDRSFKQASPGKKARRRGLANE